MKKTFVLLLFLMAAPVVFGQQGPSECKVNGTWFECWGVNSPYLVQSGPAVSTNATAKTVTATFNRLTARGNTLALACGGTQYQPSNWTATVNDTQLNYWPSAAEFAVNSTTQWAGIWIAQSTVGGTADAITLTITGSNTANQSISCYPYELPGSSFPAAPIDQISVGSNSSSAAPSTASVTTSPGIEVAITAIAAHATTLTSPSIAAGNFWTLDSSTVFPASLNLAFGSESLFLTSSPTSAVAGTATLSASNAWAAAMVTIPVMKNAMHVFGGQTTNSPAVSGLAVLPCYYNSSLPTLANGNSAYVACDANGRPLVNIFGNTGFSLDASVGAGSAPTNGLAILGQYNSTAPTPSTGQTVAMQLAPNGSLIGQPYRRSQVVLTSSTAITSVSAQPILAAIPGAFADITNLIITTTSASPSGPFTAMISDGSKNYFFDLNQDNAVGTNTININFNPPLSASSLNTQWTQTNSLATVTTHTTVVAVKQTAF